MPARSKTISFNRGADGVFGLFRRKTADTVPDLVIGGRRVEVAVVRNAKARRISLRADAVHGVVRLTMPPRAPIRDGLALINAQHGWIAARVTTWPRPLPFVPGAAIPFEGGELRLDWDEANPRGVHQVGTVLRAGGPRSTLAGRTTRWLRAQALDRLDSETRALAATAGQSVAAVSVRDPASRWGSCSSTGAITYSWRLVLAPVWIRQSVVAHEVAHLVHHNHGPEFWALARKLADVAPATSKRWLTAHGAGLHWVGRSAATPQVI